MKAANPAPWITARMLAEQRRRCADLDWLAMHCNRALVSSASWLPPGSWRCRAFYEIAPDEPLVLGVGRGRQPLRHRRRRLRRR